MTQDLAVASTLEGNLLAVRERLSRAAARAGRDPAGIRLVAVTKSVAPDRARALLAAGVADLGENRADDLAEKAEALGGGASGGARARWHFLGHLQRNKARRVVERADVIHSVDSIPLLRAIARLAGELGRTPELFVQLKLADEPEKTGLAPAELTELLDAARALPGLRLAGLMVIAPLRPAPEEAAQAARTAFRELARIARALEGRPEDARLFEHGRVRLSMGMSADFEIAVEEGSDLVRVGSALFAGLERDTGGRNAA